MKIERRFTTAGRDPYEAIAFRRTSSEIKNPDGSLVFQLSELEVPESWSQVASDVLAQKYFRKAGVPAQASQERTWTRSLTGSDPGTAGIPSRRAAARWAMRSLIALSARMEGPTQARPARATISAANIDRHSIPQPG